MNYNANITTLAQGAGEEQARAENQAFIQVRKGLVSAVKRVCPFWLQDRSEDLVQAGMLRVLQLQTKSEESRSFGASYLWKVAYSAMVDEIRRLRRAREVPLEDAAGSLPATSGSSPEQDAFGHELGREIYDCLGHLREKRRVATTLYLQGHSIVQIADLMAWKPKATENLVYRGVQQLRQCLENKGLKP